MTLIVEDGTGRPNAQAVASYADLTAYLAARGYAAPSDQDAGEAALVRGWDWIERAYRGRWLGSRIKPQDPRQGGQALAWPRSGVVNEEGVEHDAALIPLILRDANCEAARIVLAQLADLATPTVTPAVVSRRAGDWQEVYASPTSDHPAVLIALDGLLEGFVRSTPSGTWGNVAIVRN